jgi:hypothetical protein
MTENRMARMVEHSSKRGPGRPPKHGEALTGAERQSLYAKARQRDMAEVAHALKDILLRTKANQKAFSDSYRDTTSGHRLWRGLARLLADDPETMAFFKAMILSDDENRPRRYTVPGR